MSDYEIKIPDTYEEAIERKAYVLKLINEYNEALLLDKELPCTEEEIDRLQEEYQILDDHLALTEEEKLNRLDEKHKYVNEDGVVVEKKTVLDNIHWGVILGCVFTLIFLCSIPFLARPIGAASMNSMINKFFYNCLWNKEVEMYGLEKSGYMWSEFGFALRAVLAYCWLPLLLVALSVGLYFVYFKKEDINTLICKWLIVANVCICVISIAIILFGGEIKYLIERYEYLWYEYAEYYYNEIGSY